ncbi:MAG: hypothetical protein ACYTFO_06925 [Planctomycetota bacterium]|jgi:hypothetical protein
MLEPTNNMGFVQRLSTELAKDKKKTVILATLVLVGAFVGIRTFTKGTGPAKAAALAMQADESIVPPEMAMASPGFLVESDPLDEEYLAQIDRDITRDLFAFDSSHYTPLTTEELRVVAAEDEDDEQPDAVDWEAVITEQSRSLTLQSAIDSDIPIAVINGRVLGQGDEINGFQVVHIDATSCTVAKQGVQITLNMAD